MTEEVTPTLHLIKPDFNVSTWHDQVNGNFDTIDAMIFAFTGITGIIGPWRNATTYVIGNRVIDLASSRLYECLVNHTSAITGTFLQDRTAHPTFWTLVSVGIPDPYATPGDLEVGGDATINGNLNVTGNFSLTGTFTGTFSGTFSGLDINRIGEVVEFAGSIPPPRCLFCFGQAVSRATYALLFAKIGDAFGVGDGVLTFNLPDCRDRVTVGLGNMGGVSADRITVAGAGFNSDAIGAVGGFETHTLLTAQMPVHAHTNSVGNQSVDHTHAISGTTGLISANHTHSFADTSGNGSVNHSHSIDTAARADGTVGTNRVFVGAGTDTTNPSGSLHTHAISGTTGTVSANHTHSFADTSAGASVSHNHAVTIDNTGGGTAHNNVQPTIVMPKIIYTGVL